MLKKLQNLLFEEDDDMEDEEEEIEEKPKRVKKEHHVVPEQQPVAEPVAPAPVQPAPAVRNEQPSFNNIDVNQPVAEKPVEPSFDSLFQVEQKEEPKPAKKLGITLTEEKVEEKPVVKPAAKPVAKPVTKSKPKPAPTVTGYQFKPVISPIFGVDEKDLNAVKNTARKYSAPEKIKNDSNITPIISPMYGADSEDAPSMIADTVEKSEVLEKTVGNAKNYKAEDDIPEFSLDDILLASDNEFKEDIHPEASAPKKQPVNDQTMVLDKTLFPDDEGLD